MLNEKRFCIIASPRSGSTWLELMIFCHLKSRYSNAVRLGEFFTPGLENYEKFILKDQEIIPTNENVIHKHFFEERLTMLLESNDTQPSVLRLFPLTYRFNTDYNHICKIIQNKNFKFITLLRDMFETTLSWCLMLENKIVHNYGNFCTTLDGSNVKPSIKITYIDNKLFEQTLETCRIVNSNIKQLSDNFSSVKINYKSLIKDCELHRIPIEKNINIKKTYGVDSKNLIKNYNELKEIYENQKYTNN